MAEVVYRPEPRYVVERADSISALGGGRHPGGWNFEYAFELLHDAETKAARMSEENEYVRVIDRAATENKENI